LGHRRNQTDGRLTRIQPPIRDWVGTFEASATHLARKGFFANVSDAARLFFTNGIQFPGCASYLSKCHCSKTRQADWIARFSPAQRKSRLSDHTVVLRHLAIEREVPRWIVVSKARSGAIVCSGMEAALTIRQLPHGTLQRALVLGFKAWPFTKSSNNGPTRRSP